MNEKPINLEKTTFSVLSVIVNPVSAARTPPDVFKDNSKSVGLRLFKFFDISN